ncbi:hypothetical protein ACIPLC_36170 [Kitasatospora sp. NPDC086801]|uniref:hypothetical protein n=1 Tax=Kitasatospora sp. NPDC086801 TaxID=3364066 RepID=UPI0037F27628
MFNAKDRVLIVSCKDDPRAVGRIGWIVDEVPPGPLTQGRWTVNGLGFFIGPTLCETAELQKV